MMRFWIVMGSSCSVMSFWIVSLTMLSLAEVRSLV